MNNLNTFYNSLIAAFGAIIGFLFGDMHGCLIALLCFITLDFITGVLTGVVEKNLSSEVAWKGIIRKIIELIIVIAAHMVDKYICGTGNVIMTAVCFLFISTEGISLLENAARLGVPIPKKLVETLSQLKVKVGGVATVDDIKRLEAEEAKKYQEEIEKDKLKDESPSFNESEKSE